jgi:protein-tyrosine phosphatase
MNDFNKKLDWWNNSVDGLDYAEYKIRDTYVMIGLRPNCYGTTPEVYHSINAWINVSDRFVRHEKDVTNTFIPWVEAGTPQLETIWAVLRTLNYWINEQKLNRIYFSCDGGTHRAVTLFGLYLLAYESKDAELINSEYQLKGNRHDWSNPLQYASGYIQENKVPGLKKIVDLVSLEIDDPSHGVSLEDFLSGKIGKETIREFYAERFAANDLFTAWFWIKHNVWMFLSYTLTRGPYLRVNYWIHKKLNTKKGQWLKKFGF